MAIVSTRYSSYHSIILDRGNYLSHGAQLIYGRNELYVTTANRYVDELRWEKL